MTEEIPDRNSLLSELDFFIEHLAGLGVELRSVLDLAVETGGNSHLIALKRELFALIGFLTK